MLTGANEFEMFSLDSKARQPAQILPQKPVAPMPNYYFPATAVPMPQSGGQNFSGYVPYYYGSTLVPGAPIYPVYPVTQYPVYSMPIQVPVPPHQKSTLPPQALSSSAPTERYATSFYSLILMCISARSLRIRSSFRTKIRMKMTTLSSTLFGPRIATVALRLRPLLLSICPILSA